MHRREGPSAASLLTERAKVGWGRRVDRSIRISADLGYSSRSNVRAIADVGAQPLVPFKSNARGGGCDKPWSRLHAYFTLNREEFLTHYDERSMTESKFSAIKRVLGDSTKAKTYVQAMYELGIEPSFLNGRARAVADEGRRDGDRRPDPLRSRRTFGEPSFEDLLLARATRP
jgi:hypothetical protein